MTTETNTAAAPANELERIEQLANRSVGIIEAGQAPSGAYVAPPNFPVYRFSWLRDGAFIADAMSRAGRVESAEAFFDWCSGVLVARRSRVQSLIARKRDGAPVDPSELLHCRYTLDGQEATEDWWNFQLDGYGSWLWALVAHGERSARPLARYRDAIALTVAYLAAFWDEPSYDWWEENSDRRHTSTLAALYGGLAAAARVSQLPPDIRGEAAATADAIRSRVLADGTKDGRFAKWLGGGDLDGSLVSCSTPFRLVEPHDRLIVDTVAALEQELAHGGVHRYAADSYYGGGEWLLLAALLGWYYAEAGRVEDAWAQLRWVAGQATPAGELPEQVDRHLFAPQARDEWLRRWGPVATPLLWSHAMFLTLAIELGAVRAPL